MPKVNFVKAAAKDNRVAKKGESYYWWKFRYGSKHMSKTPPRPSQLTQSDFLSRQMELEERIGDLTADTFEDLKSEVEEIVSEIRSLGEEQGDKVNNLPDSLQQGPTGELLEGRASGCEEWADELEAVDLDVDEPTDDEARNDLGIDEPTEDEARESLDDADFADVPEGERQAAISDAVEAKLEELKADYELQMEEKLEELRAEHSEKLAEAISELQGCSYQGE